MPERSSITQLTNWGVEGTSTPGTAVVSGKQMTALMVEMGAAITFDSFAPAGYKYDTIVTPGKDMVNARLTGRPTFTEGVYPLSSVLGTAVITTPSGGTASRDWTFSPLSNAADVVNTFTVEVGSSVRAQKFSYGLVTGLTFTGDRDTVTLSGDMIGYAMSDGITITGTAAAVSLVPMLAKQFTIYSNATSGSLGSSALTRVLSWELAITNRFLPLWTVNQSQTSFVTHVEVKPTATLRLTVEADAAGQAHLTNARAGTTEFIRIEAIGDIIEAGTIPYKARFDLAAKVNAISDFKDDQGVYAVDYTFDIVHDSGWGKALQVVLTNTLTAL